MGRGEVARWGDGWGVGDKGSRSRELSGIGRGGAALLKDGRGGVEGRSRSSKGDGMGK